MLNKSANNYNADPQCNHLSTGAKVVDSFIANAKKLVAQLEISKISRAVHHTNRYVVVTMDVVYSAHKIQILLELFSMFFLYLHLMPSIRYVTLNKRCKSYLGS